MISLVVPFYNEEENLSLLCERIVAALEGKVDKYEVILVDDGSTDNSLSVARKIGEEISQIHVLELNRNFGQTAALQAGIDEAKGDIIVPLDADLQNDPQDIPKMLKRLDEGYDIVSGWRKNRHDGFARKIFSRVANGLIAKFWGLKLHDFGCSLKAYRKDTFRGIRLYGEVHRFIPLLMYWQGARVTEMEVKHHPRHTGESKYNLSRTFKVIFDLITYGFLSSYQAKPNYVFGALGLASLFLSFIAISIVLVRILVFGNLAATPMVFMWVILTLSSLLFFSFGLLAEMVSKLYFHNDDARPYRIRNRWGWEK